MKAINLKTEYMYEPMGIDILKPRFFWNCEGGVKQSAYQIIAEKNGIEIWDSNKVSSSQMMHIRYEGQALSSSDRITWKVKLWDEKDVESEWFLSFFEIGLLRKEYWSARWIAGNYTPKKNTRYPVDCFKKEFHTKKNVSKARMYMSACGLYEAKLNGYKVGDTCFTPGCTDYRVRIQYQTYDITQLLKEQNILEIQLADSWY